MTDLILSKKFEQVFGYLLKNVKSYEPIGSSRQSIRVRMKDDSTYIFTYPSNGYYTLVAESFNE